MIAKSPFREFGTSHLGQISRLDNVERYLESDMTAEEALSHGFDHVAVATGSVWRRDGVGRWHTRAGAMPIGAMEVLTPDDIMAGTRPEGRRVAIYDDDHVAVATGSVWRRDGVGRWHTRAGAMPIGAMEVLTPDDIMAGTRPEGRRVAIYDDDHWVGGL